jgi:hypothetical protein
MSVADAVELGASVAAEFGKSIGPVQRQLSTPSNARRHLAALTCYQNRSRRFQIGSRTGPRFLPVKLLPKATSQAKLLGYA